MSERPSGAFENQTSPPDKIALVGGSIGSNLCLKAAAGNPEIRAVMLLSPGENYRGITLGRADIEAMGTRPVFLASARYDKYSFESSRTLSRIAEQSGTRWTIHLREDRTHGTHMLGFEEDRNRFVNWLVKTLQSP